MALNQIHHTCACFIVELMFNMNIKTNRHKIDSHTQECIFLGHLNESKAYNFMENFDKRILVF